MELLHVYVFIIYCIVQYQQYSPHVDALVTCVIVTAAEQVLNGKEPTKLTAV